MTDGVFYDITPVTKPRMTARARNRAKRTPSEHRYFAFKEECRLKGVVLPTSNAHVVFYVPMPPSWSKKKRAAMLGKPHQNTPDISNLLKAIEDACYTDDKEIWHYASLTKVWAVKGAIEIRTECDPTPLPTGQPEHVPADC